MLSPSPLFIVVATLASTMGLVVTDLFQALLFCVDAATMGLMVLGLAR